MPIIKNLKSLRLAAACSKNELARLATLDRATVAKAESCCNVSELSISKLKLGLEKALDRKVQQDELEIEISN